MTEVENNIKSKAQLIDSTVFDSFKTLTSEIESERFNGSLSLLQHLDKNQDGEKVTLKIKLERMMISPSKYICFIYSTPKNEIIR